MQIKICGLMRLKDVDYVNEALPDYAGFVFYEKSRRCISKEQAVSFRKHMNKQIRAVGVFVNEAPEKIIELLKSGCIDIAQLHGDETENAIRKIKEESGKPVWKAVVIRSDKDAEAFNDSSADMLLFDGGMGSGRPFQREYLVGVKRPFFLAGGMDVQRIKEAEELKGVCGIDISSGVETDGCKDKQKMKEAVQAVHMLSEKERAVKNGK